MSAGWNESQVKYMRSERMKKKERKAEAIAKAEAERKGEPWTFKERLRWRTNWRRRERDGFSPMEVLDEAESEAGGGAESEAGGVAESEAGGVAESEAGGVAGGEWIPAVPPANVPLPPPSPPSSDDEGENIYLDKYENIENTLRKYPKIGGKKYRKTKSRRKTKRRKARNY